MFKQRLGLIFLLIFIAIIIGSFYYIFEVKYAEKIYPNIYIGGLNMEGKTILESKSLIDEKLNIVDQEGISFYYDDNKVTVYPINSSSDAAVVDVLVDFKVDETINKAMLFGRSGNFVNDSKDRLDLILGNNHYVKLIVNFDNDKIINDLKQGFSILNPQNAVYYFDSENNLLIKQGRAGKVIYYEESMNTLRNNLGELDFSNIILEGNDANPEISEADCLAMKDKVESNLALAPIKLKYNKDEWIIDKASLLEMVVLSKKESNLFIDLDKNKIKKYIEENVATEINQDYVLPKFTLNDGKVENFIPGKEGRELDIDLTVNLLAGLLTNPFEELNLSVKIIPYSNENEGVNDILGIKEIIGKYSLGFDGSTNARTSNIKNGAKSLNGLLLKPGEEFSMLEALGSIDEEHGYVKEAVIKGNAISYEFGGGLCHTSTTLFRATLDAGLPITMRQNHSYNMPYYQPAGIDATIYSPSPDFKFINDTGNYILIQAEVKNKELTIELWGIKDGRTVNRTEPVIYNIVKPNPNKIIKTYSLASGQVKCTYAAYDGADAYFDYEVTYPDGTVKKERFNSHYIPRQGVCLVGI
ncbi:MAG TPA: VanW family protein [Candidatus Pacearchaeota archaeon]|nr:VanW family protein [Candidatus Pacearchaeota archaeon]HPR79730.1 VanW family protein [Candidatus Pacearchaeota archaeon]